MGFDITEMLKNVPKSGTAPQLILVAFEKIKPDLNNGYSMDGIEELAGNIETVGLLDPLVVLPETEGVFPLISGHRRLAAIERIIKGGSMQFAAGIPCIIRTQREAQEGEDPRVTELVDRLALIMANADNRRKTGADDLREAEGIEEIVTKLADLGFKFPGRRRDWVAKITGMSKSKLGRLSVIKNGLIKPWRAKFDKGQLVEDTAYELARQPEWIQARIFNVKSDVYAAAVVRIGKIMQGGNKYSCEGLTGPGCSKCTHGDAFLRHDLENSTEPCKGGTCCLKCEKAKRDWHPCDRMCSKAKARRAAANAKEKERQATEAERKRQQLMAEIRACAVRLVKAADAAGVDDKTELRRKGCYYSGKTIGWCRKAIAGEDIGTVYNNDIASEELDVGAVAKALHCSADYICGLTDELRPVPAAAAAAGEEPAREVPLKFLGYLTCDPPDRMKCWAKFVDEDTRDFTMLATYSAKNGAWYAGTDISEFGKMDQSCIGWWPIPDDNAPDLPADLRPVDPAPQTWQTGKPPKPGLYAVRFKVSEDAPGEIHNFAKWDAGQWKAERSGRIITDMIAVGWAPLPEVKE